MAGIGDELHIYILAFLPYFAVFYLLAALRKERTVSGAFVRAEGFGLVGIVIGDNRIGTKGIGYDSLVPSRYLSMVSR